MGIKRKILSLFSAVVMGATVIFTAAGGEHVQAAETYKVNSSVADVSGNVGDTIEIPITFTTDTPTNSLLGKLRDNKNNVSYYDDTVLKFVGTEFRGMPAGLTSTAGGNFSYVSTTTSTSGTIILKFEVLKCSAKPVTVTIKDLYYTTNAIRSESVTLTSTVTIAHPEDQKEEVVTKKPTCTEKGTKEIRCKVCGGVLEEQEIAALGHKAGDWKVTKEATCTEAGGKEQRCTVCGEVVKTEEIAALGHKAGDWKVTKEATCTEAGSKEQRCTVCGEVVKTEEIPALGHKGEWKVVKASTFTEKGSKEERCSVCGELLDTKEIALKGDANNDGSIDMIDVTNIMSDLTSEKGLDADVTDLNGDGVVDMVDVTLLLEKLTEGTL
ncbi:dockerin type I domain-containing protein [Fusicatenibacter sp. CLA-AA-H213]|nr:dockerin type I domain-containing protein [Fusicatenibacter sp. CLA-AA-H213]